MLKTPSPSRASLVRHSLYKLNRIGDKQHPFLTSPPICKILFSPRSCRTLTFCYMYNLLNNLLSRQPMPILFRICINFVQLTRSNAFCQSMKQTRSSSSISKVRSAVILIIPIAFLVPFPLLNPNCSSPSPYSIFFSILRLSIFVIVFAVCAKIKDMADNNLLSTHRYIHRQNLASKKMAPELTEVLSQSVKIINYIEKQCFKYKAVKGIVR